MGSPEFARNRQEDEPREGPFRPSVVEGQRPVRMTGAQAFVECLKREGVEVIFGYPGGAVLPIYDVLYDASIRHILFRHEAAGVHMAEGYARATGKPGVILVTSGPGATNLVTGIADAYMDSTPLVCFTGNVPTSLIGRDAFQEADIVGITLPITKHNFLVRDVRDLPRVIREAFHIATTGRPGPVLVDLPKDVSNATFDFVYPEKVDLPGYRPTLDGHPKQIAEVARAIAEARRPVLYVGGGAIHAGAHEEVLRLAEKASIPTTTTLMGIGGFPGNHPLSLGMLGMHGTPWANYAVDHCDLLIAAGARFDDRVTGKVSRFSPRSKKVHIDIDPAEIGKNVRVDIPVVGDLKRVLQELIDRVPPKREEAWLAQIEAWKREYPLWYDPPAKEGEIKPQRVVEELYRLTGGDVVMTTDVGQHQMWAAQYFPFDRPRQFITSGGLGTMGYGFPAALGAQLGRPGETVICLTGDGSIIMHLQELVTAATYDLPVKVVILNNLYLGMVRQWQQMVYRGRYSHSALFDNPDFARLAEAFGVRGWRVDHASRLVPALEEALAHPGPAVVDVLVSPEENVLPMIPAGMSVDEMIVARPPRREVVS